MLRNFEKKVRLSFNESAVVKRSHGSDTVWVEFFDQDGEAAHYVGLDKTQVKKLRKALKRAQKLA